MNCLKLMPKREYETSEINETNEKRILILSFVSFISLVSYSLFLLIVVCSFPVIAQQRRPKAPAQAPAQQQSFDQLKEQADQAREAGRLDEAISLYRKGVSVRPNWIDGWWYLATLLYESDRYEEAIGAFKRTTVLQPKVGAPWAMLGLCEFRLGDYDNAARHLQQGRRIGVGDNRELGRVMRFHEGQLLLLKGDFDAAQTIFAALSYDNLNHEDLIIAHGLASLRLGMIPSQVKPDYRDRDVIRRIGFAEHQAAQKNMGDAQRSFDQAVADYSKTPGVQYAYGKFLLNRRDEDGAVAAFQREIGNSPNHALARIQIAYIKLSNKDAASGLPYAQEAVNLHPRLPLSHYILGRVLFETGDNAKAITELEVARRLAPNEPRVHFALSRAYAKAGRKVEAEQARETFARLNKQVESDGVSGDAIDESRERAKPDSH
jgi:tetratricopeptide (TPR) repeat protein